MFIGGFGQLARVPIANVMMHLNLRCGLEREPQFYAKSGYFTYKNLCRTLLSLKATLRHYECHVWTLLCGYISRVVTVISPSTHWIVARKALMKSTALFLN